MRSPVRITGLVFLLALGALPGPAGAAQFSPAPGSPVPLGSATAEGVAVGDLSGDGIDDVAVAKINGSAVAVLAGNGDGTFQPVQDVPVGTGSPSDVALADFNRDGRVDMAVSSANFAPSSNLAILINDGDGTFTETDYPAGSFPTSPAVADINGDGLLDVAVSGSVAEGTDYRLSVLLGDGNGGFGTRTPLDPGGTTPQGLGLGDYNGDAKPDIVVANTNGGNSQCIQGCGNLSYLENTTSAGASTPTFAAAQPITTASFPASGHQGTKPFGVAPVDVNADGARDIAATNTESNDVSVVLGDGDGTFGAVSYRAVGSSPFSIATADFNADGRLDAMTANNASDNASLLLGNGGGTFAPSAETNGTGQDPWEAATGDFDRDGQLDVAISSMTDDSLTVLLNTAQPAISFEPATVTFPAQRAGTAGPAQGVLVRNAGNGFLRIVSVAIAGPDAGDFTKQSDNCSGRTMFSGGTCGVAVGFSPSAVGTRTASLVVTDLSGSFAAALAGIGTGPLPPPVLGRTFNVELVSGRVLVASGSGPQLAGRAGAAQKGRRFVPLTEPRQLTVGSFLDTRRGRIRITTATGRAGSTQRGVFGSGLFQVLQSRARRARGLTTLALKGSSFRRCRRGGRGKRARAAQSIRRRLRANARGRFRTRGRHSAATVRGTVWLTADRCDGTLTRVTRGRVAVRDFRRKRTVLVRAGKSYLARAPR